MKAPEISRTFKVQVWLAGSQEQGKAEMGFLFYANFVRFVLRGGFAIVLVEQARAIMRAAGVGPEAGQ
jgi:hypothetical protein